MAKTTSDKTNGKYGTVMQACNCEHEFQDTKYKKHMRVHNLCKQGKEARCTVCGKTKSA